MKKILIGLAVSAVMAVAAFSQPTYAKDRIETLSKNSVISIALIDAHHETRDVFTKELFPKVLPAIEEAGGRLVAKFETIDVEEGNITPQHVFLLEWPSLEAFSKAANDQRNLDVLDRRAQVLRNFHIGFFKIKDDVKLELKKDVVYEWFAGNPAGPQTPNQLQTFFQNVIPTALEYGRQDQLIMQPVEFESNSYSRLIAGMATWPTAAHFEQFTNTTVFRENVKEYRDPAFANLELINTYFVE